MSYNTISRIYCLLLLLALSLPVLSETPAKDSRLKSMIKLIESSSGAQKVKTSGNEKALQLKKQARKLYKKAKKSDDPDEVKKLLDDAAKKMFEAIRIVSSKEVSEKKKGKDYLRRLKSVESLLSAQQRVSDEKNQQDMKAQVKDQVETLLKQANSFRDKGEIAGAMVMLNKAYDAIKDSLESMRSGDTLVRTLNFATKEDEYHYELDRNDTHLMLVKVLMDEKKTQGSMVERISDFLNEAKSLRAKAEKEAKTENYDRAIGILEKSTKQIVKAIRAAGVYIPG